MELLKTQWKLRMIMFVRKEIKQMEKNKIIYCDMDGVLADFFAIENANKKCAVVPNFFKELKPIKKNVEALIALINEGYQVKILTKTPNEIADNDN